MKRIWFLSLLFIITLSNCTLQDLEVPDSNEPDRLTVFAFLDCRDTITRVLVERTFGFNQAFPTIDPGFRGQATVALSRQGQSLGGFLPESGSNFYTAVHAPVGTADPVSLSVFHPLFGTVEATQDPPAVGALLSARLLKDVPLPGGVTLSRALEVRIQDTPGQANYYELYGSEGEYVTQVNFLLTDLRLAQADNTDQALSTFLFNASRLLTDDGMDGAEIRLLFNIGEEADNYPAPVLSVRYTTEAYYQYVKYLSHFRATGLTPSAAGEEPYSNFSGGGLGVFALYVEERIPVER